MTANRLSPAARVRVAVSACLAGDSVRYDGRDKREPAVVEELARIAELVRVCPEVEIGLGVPRESIELVRRGPSVRLLGVHSRADHTSAMAAFCARKVAELVDAGIGGYVFKSRSPSCGVASVPIFDERGEPERIGSGMFAAALVAAMPGLPVAEEIQLRDPVALAAFIERVQGG